MECPTSVWCEFRRTVSYVFMQVIVTKRNSLYTGLLNYNHFIEQIQFMQKTQIPVRKNIATVNFNAIPYDPNTTETAQRKLRLCGILPCCVTEKIVHASCLEILLLGHQGKRRRGRKQ